VLSSRLAGTLLAVSAIAISTAPLNAVAVGPAADGADAPSSQSPCAPWSQPVTTARDGVAATVLPGTDGSASWSVTFNGTPVVQPSALGLVRADADFTRGLRLCGLSKPRTVAETYTLTQSKVSTVDETALERDLTFRGASGERVLVTVRVFDDGAALRYAFPDIAPGRRVEITREATEFAVPKGGDSIQVTNKSTPLAPKNQEWYLDRGTGDTRRLNPMGTSSASGWSFPLTLRTSVADRPWWVYISEADLHGNYPATHVRGSVPVTDGAARYGIEFPEDDEARGSYGAGNPQVRGPWKSPWRFVVASPDLQDIVATTATTDLAHDAAERDWSWVDPGAASFSWMTSPSSLTTLDGFIPWIELSARMGWKYALADAGWDRMTDVDGTVVGVERLAEEARKRGVGLWVWVNSGGPNNVNPGTPRDVIVDRTQRRAFFERLHAAGVKGVKIDIWESNKQDLLAQQRAVLEDAADFRLMVTLHNTTVSRGLEREYPHLLGVVAAIGATYENSTSAHSDRMPEHNTILAFNRMVSGSFDYSPAVLNTDLSSTTPRRSTAAHQLALPIIMHSGLTTYGGKPEAYLGQPAPVRQLLRTLPASWDEVSFLGGAPGDKVAIARRAGATWYVAGINGKTVSTSTFERPDVDAGYTAPVGVAQTLTADLATLGCGRAAEVTLFSEADGAEAHNTITVTNPPLSPDRTLSVDTAQFGGFVATVDGCRAP
jgi:alpha-glucosidase